MNLGDPSAYLDGDRIIQIAKEQGCQGIHPGYGFVRLYKHLFDMRLTGTVVEREPHVRKEVYRGWSDLHWPAMASNRVHGKQEAGTHHRPWPR